MAGFRLCSYKLRATHAPTPVEDQRRLASPGWRDATSAAPSARSRHGQLLLEFWSPVRADAREDSPTAKVWEHSDTWLRWEKHSSARVQGPAGGVAAYRGVAACRGVASGVGERATRVSWRLPGLVLSAAPGRSVWPVCSVAGRLGTCGTVCGGSRGPRRFGVAWRRPAGPAFRVPTTTAWSC